MFFNACFHVHLVLKANKQHLYNIYRKFRSQTWEDDRTKFEINTEVSTTSDQNYKDDVFNRLSPLLFNPSVFIHIKDIKGIQKTRIMNVSMSIVKRTTKKQPGEISKAHVKEDILLERSLTAKSITLQIFWMTSTDTAVSWIYTTGKKWKQVIF